MQEPIYDRSNLSGEHCFTTSICWRTPVYPLAEMLIKHKKLRIPQSYQETFDILGESGILEPEFAFAFAKIAGFRNFLAHDYEDVVAEAICGDALSKLDEVELVSKQVEKSLPCGKAEIRTDSSSYSWKAWPPDRRS